LRSKVFESPTCLRTESDRGERQSTIQVTFLSTQADVKTPSNLRFYKIFAFEDCDMDTDTRPLEGRDNQEI
jgi:hypothetical protein